jgi:hypothetical protein
MQFSKSRTYRCGGYLLQKIGPDGPSFELKSSQCFVSFGGLLVDDSGQHVLVRHDDDMQAAMFSFGHLVLFVEQ